MGCVWLLISGSGFVVVGLVEWVGAFWFCFLGYWGTCACSCCAFIAIYSEFSIAFSYNLLRIRSRSTSTSIISPLICNLNPILPILNPPLKSKLPLNNLLPKLIPHHFYHILKPILPSLTT